MYHRLTFFFTEIGGDDLGIALDFVRRSFSDLLSEVQHHNPVSNVHDNAHVMFYQDDAADDCPGR